MSQDLIRLMQALFLPAAEGCRDGPWRPAADIYQTRQGYLVKLDLAGVRSDDIKLLIDGNRMTVRGVRRDCTTQKGCSYYQLEIAYSHFERTLELPCRLDRAHLSTDYRDGMLLVSIVPERGN